MRCNVLLLLLSLFVTVVGCGGGEHSSEDFVRSDISSSMGVAWLSVQRDDDCSWKQIFKGVKKPKLAFLWGSYGRQDSCLKSFLSDGRPKRIHIYLSNGPCERKNNCSSLEIEKEVEIAARAIQAYNLVRNNCIDCTLSLSPQLEDNFSQAKAIRLGKEIRRLIRDMSVILVRNPNKFVGREPVYDSYEFHNSPPDMAPCLWSNDGKDISDIDSTVWALPQRIKMSELGGEMCERFLWTADGNCLSADSRDAPYPHERDCSYEEFNKLNKAIQ